MQVFFILLLIILLFFIIKYQRNDLVFVKSNIDDKVYMVRNRKDKQQASNMLAKLNNNIQIFVEYLMNKINNTTSSRYTEFIPYIKQLNEKIKNVIIKETPGNTQYTSYTINKGEQIVFCIRSSEPPHNIHNINLIMYVLLHEISHVACPEYNHTPLFKKIFKFICEEAIEMGIYEHIDFNTTPQMYCGMKIYDSII